MMLSTYYPPYFAMFLIAPFVVVPLWLMALAACLSLGGQRALNVTRRLAKVAWTMTVLFTLISAFLVLGSKDEWKALEWLWALLVLWMPAVLCSGCFWLARRMGQRAEEAGQAVPHNTRLKAMGGGLLGWAGCVVGLYYLPQVWPV